MTALIKSTDGSGWVEARLNDIVSTDKFSGNFKHAKIIEIHAEDKSVSVIVSGAVAHRVWASNCQLIERPFMRDDRIECMCRGKNYMRAGVVLGIPKRGRKLNNLVSVRLDGHGKSTRYIYSSNLVRHSSPLLRPVGDV